MRVPTWVLPALAGVTAFATAGGNLARAQAPAGEVERLKADVARLEQELRQQKQLILQLMQGEQQRYEMIMQLLRSGGGQARAGGGEPALPPPPSAALAPATQAAAGGAEAAPSAGASSGPRSATVSGRVRLPPGVSEAYVYVEGLRGGPGRGRQLEIKQQGKQFTPQVAVVVTGTKVSFPNYDSVAHNAFSKSSGNAFDLGGIKAGEKSGQVVMTRTGHVEIFCNIHAKMRADVLVVGSGHYARVKPDGSFEVPGVPVGARSVALWSPQLKPQSQTVQVSASGGSVSFAAEPASRKPHLNKYGNAYGSYDE